MALEWYVVKSNTKIISPFPSYLPFSLKYTCKVALRLDYIVTVDENCPAAEGLKLVVFFFWVQWWKFFHACQKIKKKFIEK